MKKHLFFLLSITAATAMAMEDSQIPAKEQDATFLCRYCHKSFDYLCRLKNHLKIKHHASTKIRLPLKKETDASSETLSSEASTFATQVSQPLFIAIDREQVFLATWATKTPITFGQASDLVPLISQASPYCRNNFLTRRPWKLHNASFVGATKPHAQS